MMRLSTAIEEHGAFQEARGDSLSHRRDCRRVLQKLQEFLGDRLLDEITTDDLRDFISNVRRRPGHKGRAQVSDLTVQAYYRVVNAFFNRLEADDRLLKNPMRRVPKPKVAQYLIRPFTQEQLQKLLEQPDLNTFTGMRD